ncbi:MAG TPA: hypothetical protein VJ249_06410 [Candidatus Bathyarchaeia archaeon]|nr:hypothetical protein [Candidatus Bathyarchaeia archaeon]
MSAEETKLSAYVAFHSVISRNLSLFAGFTFTAITILITRFPDPSTWQSQTMLFFLAALFYTLLYGLYDNEALLSYCVVFAPKLPQRYSKGGTGPVYIFSWLMLGSSLWLLFLLCNLLYLALATGIMFTLFVIMAYRMSRILNRTRKPYQRINLHGIED